MNDRDHLRENMPRMRGPPGGRMPRGPTEKAKDFKGTWKKLFAFMGGYRKFVIIALMLAAGSTVCTLAGPDQLKTMADTIQAGLFSGNVDTAKVVGIGTLLIMIYASSAILSFSQGFILATVSQKIAGKLRSGVSDKINRMPLSYFDRNSTGDTLSRITNDADTVGQSLNQSLGGLIMSITMIVGSVVMMTVTNFWMALTAVLSSMLGFIFVRVIISHSQKYFSMQQDNLGLMNGHVEETYAGHNIMQAYNGTKAAKKEFDEINSKLRNSSFKSQALSGMMMPLMNFIGNFGYVMVCIVGAMLAIGGEITFGVIVAFIVYVRLFTQPLSQMAQSFNGMQSVAAAAERVFAMLEEPEMDDETHKVKELGIARGDVEFRDVHFGYVPGKEVIKGFSAKISAGQKVAIVGPTGAGKTTIVNLLMRFYETDSGDILIDGIPIKEVRREEVRRQFCMVLQDTWTFEGTVRENIAYGEDSVEDAKLEEVCKAVGIHNFITALPKGYDTVLNDFAGLSAGQKQQLTIARAMIHGAPLLILDEATSSVDTRTEKIIQEAMDRLMHGRTSFVIAHRLSTIVDSDLILIIKDGNVVEQGTHAELLKAGGFYCELYNSQFEGCD